MWLATVFGQGGALPPGRATASSVATHLATQVLAAVPRPDVLIHYGHVAAWIKPRAAVENLLSL